MGDFVLRRVRTKRPARHIVTPEGGGSEEGPLSPGTV